MFAAEFQDAQRSLDIIADLDPKTRGPNGLGCWMDALVRWVNPTLQRRCLLHLGESEGGADINATVLDACRETGWAVRTTDVPPSEDMFVIDERHAFSVLGRYVDKTVKVGHAEKSGPLINHVRRLWQVAAEATGVPELLYEDLIRSTPPAEAGRIITISATSWDRIISALLNSPTDLRTLPPRRFEELIAELLARDGFDVQLTPQTRDGGCDVFASHRHLGLLYVVECKRWSERNPIGVALVRALYGVVEHQRATAGLLVTTSRFSSTALEFAEPLRYRLSLKDYPQLVEWLRTAGRSNPTLNI